MRRIVLLFGMILIGRLLSAQPNTLPSAIKANAEFNRQVVDAIKSQQFSFIYARLDPQAGFDTVTLGQTLLRYANEAGKPEYTVLSTSRGWSKDPKDGSWSSMYFNSWKELSGDQKFSVETWFENKNGSFVIDRILFDCNIDRLFSTDTKAADSLNEIVRYAILHNDPEAIQSLFKPGIKINNVDLAKTVKDYSLAITDTSYEFSKHYINSIQQFPEIIENPESVENTWRKNYTTFIMIEVKIVSLDGKFYADKISFVSLTKRQASVAFPGGAVSNDMLIPPPPPPMPH
jgi:hypothetical protein